MDIIKGDAKMQNNCCANCASSGIHQTIFDTMKFCPCCREEAPLTIAPRVWCETIGNFRDRGFAALEDAKALTVEVEAAPVKKPRCPHYATIKAFFQAAKESGLDTISDAGKDRCRGALGVYLGKRIESRAELMACDWENGITAIKAGVLFW
jgi:hypothetical protein